MLHILQKLLILSTKTCFRFSRPDPTFSRFHPASRMIPASEADIFREAEKMSRKPGQARDGENRPG